MKTTTERQCSCDPMAYHSNTCEASPIFAEVFLAGDYQEMWSFPDAWPFWTRVQYACYADRKRPHLLREINGPEHYCEQLHDVVSAIDEDDEYDYFSGYER